jgi:glycosyltransferase involved in cell wall biosynthesis
MLTILQVAYPMAPVSMDAAGGAEQVMAILDRALVAAGHRSIAVACEGSHIAGELLSFPIAGSFDDRAVRSAQAACGKRIDEALERWRIELVHMHGVDFYEYLPSSGVPVLATLHLPVSFYPRAIFELLRPDTYLHCVSESARQAVPKYGRVLATIENGIPLELYPDRPAVKAGYCLALGRICPEKGFHLALEAARRAGMPLWLAGKVFPYREHQRYFEEELSPYLTWPHRFVGPVDLAQKKRLLRRARCLLAPSLASETSSLVAMEAMACGTPVIAFPAGALAELLEDGRTGFLVRGVEEMAEAIARVGVIDRRQCRRAAMERFSGERMAGRYLTLYEELRSFSFETRLCSSESVVFNNPEQAKVHQHTGHQRVSASKNTGQESK